MLHHKYYEVKWIDITHSNDWQSREDIDELLEGVRNEPMRNVWLFVDEVDGFYIFSSGYDKSNDNYFDCVILPRGVVVKITNVDDSKKVKKPAKRKRKTKH